MTTSDRETPGTNGLSPESNWHVPGQRARRWGFAALVVLTSGAGTALMAGIMASGGWTALEWLILALFAPTFSWITVPFWTAVIGAVLVVARRHPITLERLTSSPSGVPAPLEPPTVAVPASDALAPNPLDPDPLDPNPLDPDPLDPTTGAVDLPRTALAVPVYNEDPDAVARRLSGVARSLEQAGLESVFDVHLLSDTDDPAIAEREEAAWARLQGMHPRLAFFYRRRERNVGRKAGNIAEFCRRCRGDYRYLVVLDADSTMSAETLRALVERMEAHPRLALVQTVPLPIGQTTLFGRFVQFAAHLHAPLLAAGLAFWQGDAANYWGHNAILRLEPFTRHARLPVLPGRPPLGGPILSHDFVEAALLRRAGWQVVLDPTLGGSFEEVPETLPDFGRRDRRWAQGSLQHLRLLTLPGLHPLNRVHFVLGALGYLSSVLWLFTLLAGTAYVLSTESGWRGIGWAMSVPQALQGAPRLFGASLLGLTAGLLFVPKGMALGLGLLQRRRAFGGGIRLALGALTEALLSVLLAPVLMLEHTRYVAQIVAGGAVGWQAQTRGARVLPWSEALRAGAPATVLGATWLGATLAVAPTYALWLAPIFTGLLLAIPLLRWTSSPAIGSWLARRGLLSGPGAPAAVAPPQAPVGTPLTTAVVDLSDPIGVPGEPLAPRRGPSRTPQVIMYKAERGLFDLQRGRPIVLRSGPAPEVAPAETGPGAASWHRDALIAGVESLDAAGVTQLVELGHGPVRVIVSRHRVEVMGWLRDASTSAPATVAQAAAVALVLDGPVDVQRIHELAADPKARLDGVHLDEATDVELAGLSLVHLARLLPAIVAVPVDRVASGALAAAIAEGRVLEAEAGEAREFAEVARASVVRVSEAPVPLSEAEHSKFTLFRESFGLAEHVAIQVGDPADWPDPVPVRLHSACLTGDLFGSLRCDCGEQLRGSMSLFAARGGGVLLYLAQEGRGIGLGNKFRAYTLQETGLDTIDADGTLGFGADEREYDVAIQILKELGIERVELLTNNPEKVQALEAAGIRVAHRRPLHGRLNRHNLPYVQAKVNRAGHWLRDMLSESLAGD